MYQIEHLYTKYDINESLYGENLKGIKGNAAVVTFDRLQVVYGEFQALATPDYSHRVPLIIIEARTRKDGLWAFTYT